MAEISRRALISRAALAAGAGVGLALGFGRTVKHKVAVPPPAPPAGLVTTLDQQRSLAAGYQRLAGGELPGLAAVRSDLTEHGLALQALLERYPGWRLAHAAASSPAPGPATIPATVADLAAASSAAATTLTTTCLTWPATEPNAAQVLPALASIAACWASHAALLRSPQ